MFKIKTLNKISSNGMKKFHPEKYTCGDDVENPDAILVRSASMHDTELPQSLKAIARAGAGTNNIPLEKCTERGIAVFNTPGANANAVKELVLAGLLLSSRKILNGANWVGTLKGKGGEVGKMVEKGKSAFTGPEIEGKTLGVIGLGAIGVLVANAAERLGMNVYGYDPYLSVDVALRLSRNIVHSTDIEDIYANCDYISIHAPLTDDTKHLICDESIAKMKDGVRILNYARAELVDSEAIVKALDSGKVAAYVVDFPTDEVIGVDGVIAIPHLGASTPESEENCAAMAAKELKDYLERGAIANSVNLPTVPLGAVSGSRVCVFHKNVPHVIAKISSCFSHEGVNIEKLISNSRGDYAYTVADANTVNDNIVQAVKGIDNVIWVRVIAE